jgi:hypothetical protein
LVRSKLAPSILCSAGHFLLTMARGLERSEAASIERHKGAASLNNILCLHPPQSFQPNHEDLCEHLALLSTFTAFLDDDIMTV